MSNKPVPFNSPAGVVSTILGMVPAGASVSISLPVAPDRNINVSVGISQAFRPQAQPEQQRAIDMSQELSHPAQFYYQQPEVD